MKKKMISERCNFCHTCGRRLSFVRTHFGYNRIDGSPSYLVKGTCPKSRFFNAHTNNFIYNWADEYLHGVGDDIMKRFESEN